MKEAEKGALHEISEEVRERYWREMEERADEVLDIKGDPFVLFRIDGEPFLLPVEAARAVVPWIDPTPLPYQRGHILGVVIVRGRPVSVTRLGVLLGLAAGPEPKRRLLLVAAWEEMETALAVDAVDSIIRLERAGIEAPDVRWRGSRAGLVAGSATLEGERACVLAPRYCLIEQGGVNPPRKEPV